MPPPANRTLVLFPGALGDFLCFLPTLTVLRTQHSGHLLLVIDPTLQELVRLPCAATASIDRREIADLFVSDRPAGPETQKLLAGFSSVYSWTGFGNPDVGLRLAKVTSGQVNIYPFRGMEAGEHAVEYYGRCVGVVPQTSIGSFLADDVEWFETFERQHQIENSFVVVHPGSGSTKKNWRGFEAIVRRYHEQEGNTVVLLQGPAEMERPRPDYGADVTLDGLSLPRVAALLRHSRFYIGNDSGVSHLAGAVGACGLVLFGPTDPTTWAPRSSGLHILHAPEPCSRCGNDLFCLHRLPAERVLSALGACSSFP
ncbi:MAG: glycosyltransferase family 9 protein [Candidatus Binatia bacterium]